MRTAFIFDIHANMPALEAVLDAVAGDSPDAIVHGGDLVGWGPRPNDVIARIGEAGIPGVVGNHELLALGAFTEESPVRNASTDWTREQLTQESLAAIESLPVTIATDVALISHANPAAWAEPPCGESFPYVYDTIDLMKQPVSFAEAPGGIVVTGHVHRPAVFVASLGGMAIEKREMTASDASTIVELSGDQSAFVVAGSVGKPRDGVACANYLLVDSATITLRRVSYNVERVCEEIRESELPDLFADDLSEGI